MNLKTDPVSAEPLFEMLSTAPEPRKVAAYQNLLAFCPDLAWKPPWDFVPCDTECRGPIAEPEAALDALRKEFSDESLMQVGILDRSASGALRLHPALCDPAGAVLPLRASTGRTPYDLLTSCGCLSGRPVPAFAVRHDAFTFLTQQTTTLFATSSVREAALLRGLGFAATLTHGLDRLSEPSLRALNKAFDIFAPGKGRLVLVGWQLLALQREVPPVLAAVASHLAGSQTHLGLELPGVCVWYPKPEFVKNLEFRVRLRDVGCARQLLREHQQDLHELQMFAGVPGCCKVKAAEPADFAEAQANLLAELGQSRDHLSEFAERAQRHYDASTQRDLVEPLQSWARSHPEPIVRNAGTELATLARLLHQLSPRLLELQRRAVDRTGLYDAELMPRQVLTDYLLVLSRFERLAGVVARWQRPP